LGLPRRFVASQLDAPNRLAWALQHLLVRHPYNANTSPCELVITLSIGLGPQPVHASIDLHRHATTRAVEIKHAESKRMLTPKVIAKLVCTEIAPQPPFGFRHSAAQMLGRIPHRPTRSQSTLSTHGHLLS
jgi:hypothetical protein